MRPFRRIAAAETCPNGKQKQPPGRRPALPPRGVRRMGILAATVCLTGAPALADGHRSLTLAPIAGIARAEAKVIRDDGSRFSFRSSNETALGARLTYTTADPAGGAGSRYALVSELNWHDISATRTDATLGQVTLDSTWSGSVTGQAGYDFGGVMPYLRAGLSLSDAAVATAGQTPASQVGIGLAYGAGVAAQVADGWSLSIDAQVASGPEHTPRGGGGKASVAVGQVRIGLGGRF